MLRNVVKYEPKPHIPILTVSLLSISAKCHEHLNKKHNLYHHHIFYYMFIPHKFSSGYVIAEQSRASIKTTAQYETNHV